MAQSNEQRRKQTDRWTGPQEFSEWPRDMTWGGWGCVGVTHAGIQREAGFQGQEEKVSGWVGGGGYSSASRIVGLEMKAARSERELAEPGGRRWPMKSHFWSWRSRTNAFNGCVTLKERDPE